MTRGFSDRALVPGTIRGLRGFRVTPTGKLVGPYYPQTPFGAEVNDAECLSFFPKKHLSDHVLGGANCTCGFYAYYNGQNEYGQWPNCIPAVIEGSGVCSIGEFGFRASKARLVAYARPTPRKVTRAERFALWAGRRRVLRRMGPLLFWCGILGQIPAHVVDAPRWVHIAGIMGAVVSVVLETSGSKGDEVLVKAMFQSPHIVGLDLLAENYPGVPVFDSEEAMLAAFPVEVPQALLEATDPEPLDEAA